MLRMVQVLPETDKQIRLARAVRNSSRAAIAIERNRVYRDTSRLSYCYPRTLSRSLKLARKYTRCHIVGEFRARFILHT